MESLESIASRFDIKGNIISIKPLGEGFINDTYIVKTSLARYILQRKNKNVFPDVPAMMRNIAAVTAHIKGKVNYPLRETLTIIPLAHPGDRSFCTRASSFPFSGNDRSEDGAVSQFCYEDASGQWWAMCLFIEGTVTHKVASSLELTRQGGIGIGRFQALLADFDQPLAEVIKGFHNMRWRFEQWDEAIDAAKKRVELATGPKKCPEVSAESSNGKIFRINEVAGEVAFIEDHREKMMQFWNLVESGYIPRRVAHNDTKLSNILFDATSGEALCAIDLDTVMSSTSLNDVGDAIRSYANATTEDDPDISKVSMRLDIYRAWMEGYLSQRASTLTDSEKEWLPFAPLFITYEQVLRFLMDYINGDTYYKVKYPEHNLVRTRNQIALYKSMEQQYDAMKKVVEELIPNP